MTEKVYKVEEVAKHNSEDDCWIILYDKVYDVTNFMICEHSGGFAPLGLAGKDATPLFNLIHPKYAHKFLDDPEFNKKYLIGYVENPRYKRADFAKTNKSLLEIQDAVYKHLSNNKLRDEPRFHLFVLVSFIAFIILYLYHVKIFNVFTAIVLAMFVAIFCTTNLHCANHGAITKNKHLADLYSILNVIPVGLSPYKWRNKHYSHHNDTMTKDDKDNLQEPFARMDPNQPYKWYYKYQYIYVPILLCTLQLQYIMDDIIFTIKGKYTTKSEQFKYLIIISLFIFLYFIIPLRKYSLKRVFLIFLVFSITLSIITSSEFIINHMVTETNYSDENKRVDIAKTQIEGSHNVATNRNKYWSHFVNFISGGLSYQIEHHLFPSIHFTYYPEINHITRAYAKKQGIKYPETKSLLAALKKSRQHLKDLGKQ
ncbi:MAG: hypothetical protein EBU66_19530 [Bacteroidetes bacterium]|nr:hypothetical protein [Bacteroidota bacterium]